MPDLRDRTDSFAWGPGGDADNTSDDPVIRRAKEHFKRGMKWEATARQRWVNDRKFAEADSDNFYQWPDQVRRNRDVEARPCLTLNKTRQHNLQIINDAKQNKPGIKVSPTGNEATYEAAQCVQNLFRHIESKSKAQNSYMLAVEFQVKAGMGYWRVVTDYVSPNTWDQEVYIRPIPDPLTVILDCDIKQPDGRDANWGLIFEDIPRELFLKLYPEYKNSPPPMAALDQETTWNMQDKVRRAEYFEREQAQDTLWEFEDPLAQGGMPEILTMLGSELDEMPKEIVKTVKASPTTRSRDVLTDTIWWYMIVGEEVKSKTRWPGKYIPIVRLPGEEVVIEGLLDRKGHTRALKDAQRMYNYHSSASVEYAALQSKTPYLAPAQAIENLETYWDTANTENHAVLPYNHLDDEGNPMPPPERQPAPQFSPAYLQGMQTASQEMMMVSGQYAPQMGEPSNERSGKAINERQRQGDNSTYGFIDRLGMAIVYTADIVLDLIPHVYDTKRVFQIQALDGKSMTVELDPNAQKVYQQKLNHQGEVIAHVLNPVIGEYWVEADMGPAYGTRRQEAFNAFSLIMAENPAAAQLVLDLYFKSADFPLADEAAERARRAVPPAILGEGPSAQEQQLQQQLTQATGALKQSMTELGKAQLELKGKEQLRDIEGYDAETKRISAMAKVLPMDPTGLKQMIHQLVGDALQTHITQIQEQNSAQTVAGQGASALGQAAPQGLPDAPPMAGARKAPDGEWYVNDPARPGKYARVRRTGGALQ